MAEEDRRKTYDDNGNTIYQAEFVDKVMMEDAIKAAYQYMMATAMKYSYFAHSTAYNTIIAKGTGLTSLTSAEETSLQAAWKDQNNNIGLGYYIEKAMIERVITDNVHKEVASLKKMAASYATATGPFADGEQRQYSARYYSGQASTSADSARSAQAAAESARDRAEELVSGEKGAAGDALAELLTSNSSTSIKGKIIKIGNNRKEVYPTLNNVVKEILQEAAIGQNTDIAKAIKDIAGTGTTN